MRYYKKSREFLTRRFNSERAATMVEYALLVALIALVCFIAMRLTGQTVSRQYSTLGSVI